MRIPRTEPRKARIEIIPMIDAIFFLLVFFMFSSLSMVRLKGVALSLPTDKAGAPAGKDASQNAAGETPKLVVTVTAFGDYYLNKTKISLPTLQDSLQSEVDAKKGAIIIVNIAQKQTTQSLINVMDSINRVRPPGTAPLTVLIATEPVDAQGNALAANATPGNAVPAANGPLVGVESGAPLKGR